MRFDLSARLVWLAAAGLLAGAGAAWIVSMAGSGRSVVPMSLSYSRAVSLSWWARKVSGLSYLRGT
jgi:hypothetical protein